MSQYELPIDPSLRDQPTPTSTQKRKARTSLSKPTPSPASRVTRRSAANVNSSTGESTGEPARGEEENLIGYVWERGDNVSKQYHPVAFC